MRKYILFSFIPAGSGTPVHVAVPYETDKHLAALMRVLCIDKLSDVEAMYLGEIYEASPIGTIQDLSLFTHFIRKY